MPIGNNKKFKRGFKVALAYLVVAGVAVGLYKMHMHNISPTRIIDYEIRRSSQITGESYIKKGGALDLNKDGLVPDAIVRTGYGRKLIFLRDVGGILVPLDEIMKAKRKKVGEGNKQALIDLETEVENINTAALEALE